MLFLMTLTIFISSCSYFGSQVKFDIPEKPQLPEVKWQKEGAMYCVDNDNAKNIIKQKVLRDKYEEQLKAVINACNATLN